MARSRMRSLLRAELERFALWPRFDPKAAMALQRAAAGLVETRDRVGRVRRVAGLDVSFVGERGRAAAVICDARTLEPLEVSTAEGRSKVPYVPGLLAFREVPLLLEALSGFRFRPDLLLVDGMGLIHPRRFGIACHLGVLLDLPAIGCGKTPFVGEWSEPAKRRGSWSEVADAGECLGAVLRTRDGVKPIFVSTGHRISLKTAIRWALRTAVRARVPEPIRLAHLAARAWLR